MGRTRDILQIYIYITEMEQKERSMWIVYILYNIIFINIIIIQSNEPDPCRYL